MSLELKPGVTFETLLDRMLDSMDSPHGELGIFWDLRGWLLARHVRRKQRIVPGKGPYISAVRRADSRHHRTSYGGYYTSDAELVEQVADRYLDAHRVKVLTASGYEDFLMAVAERLLGNVHSSTRRRLGWSDMPRHARPALVDKNWEPVWLQPEFGLPYCKPYRNAYGSCVVCQAYVVDDEDMQKSDLPVCGSATCQGEALHRENVKRLLRRGVLKECKLEGCYYVYTIAESESGPVFYVGKGKGGRVRTHFKPVPAGYAATPVQSRIHELIEKGTTPVVRIVFKTTSEREAFTVESGLIRRLPDLVNIAGRARA